jgi:uncharacterized protein
VPPIPELMAALGIVTVAAFLQGIVGIGFNVLAVPTLLLINPLLAPVPSLLLAIPLTVSQLLRERSSIDRSGVGWIIAGRLPGGLIGLWLLVIFSQRLLDLTVALIVLAAVATIAGGQAIRRTRTTEFGTGVVSGITGIVSAIGGPPVALLYRDSPPPLMRSTVAVVFSIGISISIALRILGGQITMIDLQIALLLLPGVAIGFSVSSKVKGRVDGPWIRTGILVVSAMASIALLLRSILGT